MAEDGAEFCARMVMVECLGDVSNSSTDGILQAFQVKQLKQYSVGSQPEKNMRAWPVDECI